LFFATDFEAANPTAVETSRRNLPVFAENVIFAENSKP
jgi:hypothetical protein